MNEPRPELQYKLPDELQFRPRWWWDPVPEWLLRHLEQETILELAKVQLEFQRELLTKQAEATGRVIEVIGRSRS